MSCQIFLYFINLELKVCSVQFELRNITFCNEISAGFLSSVLSSSPVPDAPLEVGGFVGLDEGVDGSNSSLCMVWGWSICRSGGTIGGRSVSPDSQLWKTVWEKKIRSMIWRYLRPILPSRRNTRPEAAQTKANSKT